MIVTNLRTETNLEKIEEFFNGRFQHWLEVLEAPLIHNNKISEYYFDNNITYVDIFVSNYLDGLHELLRDKLYNLYIRSKHSILDNLYERIVNRPRIKQLLDQQANDKKVFMPDWKYGEYKKNIKRIEEKLFS